MAPETVTVTGKPQTAREAPMNKDDWNWQHHADDCLMRLYCSMPFEEREYWPAGFSSRPQLCTCGLVPDAEAVQPEHADDRRELERWLE